MSPSIWGLVLFVFNSSLREQWGHWKGLLWTDVGFVLTFLAAGSSCEAPGKASLGIKSWEVLSTSTALPDSPPHTTRFSWNFCARCWSLWCSWLVTGSKDIFTTWAQHKVFLTLPGAPTFLTLSIAGAQGTVWLRMMHVTKKWGVFTCREICALTMGIWLEVSKVILKSSIPAITEGDASHVP